MSKIRVTNIAALTASAPSGKTEIYVDSSDKRLATIDDAGLVRKMLEEKSTLYRLLTRTVISATATVSYTPTSGVDALLVQAIGAGGAGGGCTTAATNGAAGGGGGGGAYAELFTTTIKTFTIAIGVGGAGATSANGASGTPTTFDSPAICKADGGLGGTQQSVTAPVASGAAGGAGGVTANCTGDVKQAGDGGGVGALLAAAQTIGAKGGVGFQGGGAATPNRNATAAGPAAVGPGAGGGGATIISGGANGAGGAGGNGMLIIWEFQAIT